MGERGKENPTQDQREKRLGGVLTIFTIGIFLLVWWVVHYVYFYFPLGPLMINRVDFAISTRYEGEVPPRGGSVAPPGPVEVTVNFPIPRFNEQEPLVREIVESLVFMKPGAPHPATGARELVAEPAIQPEVKELELARVPADYLHFKYEISPEFMRTYRPPFVYDWEHRGHWTQAVFAAANGRYDWRTDQYSARWKLDSWDYFSLHGRKIDLGNLFAKAVKESAVEYAATLPVAARPVAFRMVSAGDEGDISVRGKLRLLAKRGPWNYRIQMLGDNTSEQVDATARLFVGFEDFRRYVGKLATWFVIGLLLPCAVLIGWAAYRGRALPVSWVPVRAASHMFYFTTLAALLLLYGMSLLSCVPLLPVEWTFRLDSGVPAVNLWPVGAVLFVIAPLFGLLLTLRFRGRARAFAYGFTVAPALWLWFVYYCASTRRLWEFFYWFNPSLFVLGSLLLLSWIPGIVAMRVWTRRHRTVSE